MYIENSRGPRTDPCGTPYFTRAVVLESGLGLESGLETFFYRLELVSDLIIGLANVPVGLDRVQVYMLFFLFRNKTLIWHACSENG